MLPKSPSVFPVDEARPLVEMVKQLDDEDWPPKFSNSPLIFTSLENSHNREKTPARPSGAFKTRISASYLPKRFSARDLDATYTYRDLQHLPVVETVPIFCFLQ